MPRGYLALVLHAHLPYIRHPEHADFLEERWLFEAIHETYLPLLRLVEGLEEDGVDYALTVSLSPTLVTMLEDPLLRERYAHHLRELVALADREVERTLSEPALHPLARWYADYFRDMLYAYEERYARDLAGAFRRLAAGGRLELMTCAATHGFLPLLARQPGAVRAQVHTAVEYHESVFGRAPEGMWVPECAYYEGLEEILAAAGIRYFFVDAHGIERAAPTPPHGVHTPVVTPAGVAAFGRDPETSHQVWAAEVGYPGHPDYREFYRDIGYDLDEAHLGGALVDGHLRCSTGIKYFRITDRAVEEKAPYDPDRARETAAGHADDFVRNRLHQVERLAAGMERPPLVVSPYDAELFGHWWFEGPWFLDMLFRKLAFDQDAIRPVTPGQVLDLHPENPGAVPAPSSWGFAGTYEYWLNPKTDRLYADLHRAAETMSERVRSVRAAGGEASTPARRALRQMARELLLAQASDWPFIMRSDTSPEYARRRVEAHLGRFYALDGMLRSGEVDAEALGALEYTDRIFPDIRPEWYLAEDTGISAASGE